MACLCCLKGTLSSTDLKRLSCNGTLHCAISVQGGTAYTYTLHSCVCMCVCVYVRFLSMKHLSPANRGIIQPSSESCRWYCFTSECLRWQTAQKWFICEVLRRPVVPLFIHTSCFYRTETFSATVVKAKNHLLASVKVGLHVLHLLFFSARAGHVPNDCLGLICGTIGRSAVRSAETGLRYSSCCRLLFAVTLEVCVCVWGGGGWGVIYRETAGFTAGTGCRADECVCLWKFLLNSNIGCISNGLTRTAFSISFTVQRNL